MTNQCALPHPAAKFQGRIDFQRPKGRIAGMKPGIACVVGIVLAGLGAVHAQTEAAPPAGDPNAGGQPAANPLPQEFVPLQAEAEKLAQSVDKALADVKRAMTTQNRQELIRALDAVIANIQGSVDKTAKELEPEAFRTMERAQEKARELKGKAGQPSFEESQRQRLLKMAERYTANAAEGVEIIKRLQDTRGALEQDLKTFENEKEVIIDELELLGFEDTLKSLREVVDNMGNVSLKIRGMVSGPAVGPSVVTPPAGS